MRRGEICLVEYQGRCDTEGNAVGHGPKVLAEYYELLTGGALCPRIAAPETVLRAVAPRIRRGAKLLPRHIVMKSGDTFIEKIRNKLRMFANIRAALCAAEGEILWFFNTEFYLMLYLALFGAHGRRIVCTMFQDGWHGGIVARIKQRVFERAQKRMYRIISTGPDFRFRNAESCFLPDYVYTEEDYAPYRAEKKEERAVCLGTMGAEKDIESLVECFTRLGYPLLIAGRFYDKARVERLRESAGEQITIRDAYLTREEYLTLLGKAAYCILPYPEARYATQTSGVLQEAMFLDTIPVAPARVLTASGVPGLAAEHMRELQREQLIQTDRTVYIEQYRQLREETYHRDKMRGALEAVFLSATPGG